MTEPFRLRYVSQIVGSFFLMTLVLLLAFIIYMVRVKEVFVRSLPYEIQLEQSELGGLRQNTEIYLLGHIVGRITSVEYIPGTTRLRANLSIKETFLDSLFEDSQVHMRRRFGVGEPYLEILRGLKSERLMPRPSPGNPERFTFVPEQDRLDVMERQIDRVKTSIERVERAMVPALSSIQRAATSTSNQVDSSVGPAAKKVGDSSESMAQSTDKMQRKVDEALTRLEASAARFDAHLDEVSQTVKSMERDSRETTAAMRASADTFSESIVDVKDNMNAAFEKFGDASREMKSVMQESQGVVRDLKSETADLTGTAAKANDAAGGAQDVVNGLKQHWLLKRYVKPNGPTRPAPAAGVRGSDG